MVAAQLQANYKTELEDITRVRLEKEQEVPKMIRKYNNTIRSVMERLGDAWAKRVKGKGRKGRGKLSERIMRHMSAHAQQTQRPSVNDETIDELDAEITRMMANSKDDPDTHDAILRLMRHRTQAVDRVIIAATKRASSHDFGGEEVASLLKESKTWEAKQEGVEAVAWRLREIINREATDAVDTQLHHLRCNLEDARGDTLQSFDEELEKMQRTVDRHLERLRAHEVKEVLPPSVGPWPDVEPVIKKIELLFSRPLQQ